MTAKLGEPRMHLRLSMLNPGHDTHLVEERLGQGVHRLLELLGISPEATIGVEAGPVDTRERPGKLKAFNHPVPFHPHLPAQTTRRTRRVLRRLGLGEAFVAIPSLCA